MAPVYAGELPMTVRKFLENASFKTDYFYLLLTYGNKDSIASSWVNEFCLKQGIDVDYIQTIKMVDNYLPSCDMEEEMAKDKKIDEQMKVALENIQSRKQEIPKPSEEDQQLYEKLAKRFQEHPELNNGESILMTERCVGCSICSQVCPIGNIVMEDGKAKRISKTCDFCLACVQNCPFKAIDLVQDKNPNARYRHPNITLKDIVKSNQQGE